VIRKLSAAGVQAPLIPMGYYNPILAYGIEEFARDLAEAGGDGLIAVDLPPEESGPLHEAMTRHNLRMIYLLAPTSTDERIAAVAKRASGFVYCVSVTGVTGARDELSPDLTSFVERVRKRVSLPIAVGFGISQPKHFQAVGRIADGAVIGSAIIDEIAQSAPSEREARLKHYAEVVTGRRGAAA
jgi:tryptophan synthase alpha subunit